MLALECVKCMNYYIITLQLLYLVYVILKFCTNLTNVNSLFTVSKCFSVLTTLLISSNSLTRVEGDALVFNQVEGAFGLDLRILSFSGSQHTLFSRVILPGFK